MSETFKVTAETSVLQDIIPFIQPQLIDRGYALLSMQDLSSKLEDDMLILTALIGSVLSDNMSYHVLESAGSPEHLVAHTEGISNSSGIIPYFVLACITTPATGGETRLFDARTAAQILNSEHPELSKTVIEYSSLANPNERMSYSLTTEDPEYGPVLRYRSEVVTNKIVAPGMTPTENVYRIVDHVLSQSVILHHQWASGDILVVNNHITLHDRLPYNGVRRMLRLRFGDPLNKRICY